MASAQTESVRIAMLVPDLGLGGAQRLFVNMALGFKNKGHQVKFYTPFHDRSYCYEETVDGTFDVEEHGRWWPRTIFKKFFIFCIMMRMIICSLWMILFDYNNFDVVVMDRVSVTVPLFRLVGKKVIFYLHFPDKLLCYENQRKGILKNTYRFFMDLIEEFTLAFSHVILANSLFTQQNYMNTFRFLRKLKVKPDVLYPAIDFAQLEKIYPEEEFMSTILKPYFLSLNRYDEKKDLHLAIRAYAALKAMKPDIKHKLVLAGGYEPRREDCDYDHLVNLAGKLGLKIGEDIQFLKNISEAQKSNLLRNATCCIYTPLMEHFGMVPVEAMYLTLPVIACTTGGPKESVLDGITGFLIPQDPKMWAEKMLWFAEHEKERKIMGEAGKNHVKDFFSLVKFQELTNTYVMNVLKGNMKKKTP